MTPQLSRANLRAALWANRALAQARRQLKAGQVGDVRLACPPELPTSARQGVEGLLRRRRHSCLEAALIRQEWLAAHGDRREVVIGVRSPTENFIAHAWVDGEEPEAERRFSELTRLP